MKPLDFDEFRIANVRRLPQFKDRKGRICHKPDGSDWALSAWSNAVCGELGEAANLIKKIERGDLTLDEAREALGKELADVVTYLDLLAFRAGVDLGVATIAKFNEVSERVGADVRLPLEPPALGALAESEPRGAGEHTTSTEGMVPGVHPAVVNTDPAPAVALIEKWLTDNHAEVRRSGRLGPTYYTLKHLTMGDLLRLLSAHREGRVG